VLHDEDPDPEEGEEAARKDEAVTDTSLDKTISTIYTFSGSEPCVYLDSEFIGIKEDAEKDACQSTSDG
jgi:hypothetical protein